MKRAVLFLCLGLGCGIAAHVGYLQLRSEKWVGSPGEELAWMRDELKLSPAQYERIASLHTHDQPRVKSLADRVASLQRQMDAFEATRRENDQVDFVAFARFVDTYARVSQECETSTRKLVQDTAAMLDPEQRRRYLSLVEPWVTKAPPPSERVVH